MKFTAACLSLLFLPCLLAGEVAEARGFGGCHGDARFDNPGVPPAAFADYRDVDALYDGGGRSLNHGFPHATSLPNNLAWEYEHERNYVPWNNSIGTYNRGDWAHSEFRQLYPHGFSNLRMGGLEPEGFATGLDLPTDLSAYANGNLEHAFGYLGTSRGLTAYDGAATHPTSNYPLARDRAAEAPPSPNADRIDNDAPPSGSTEYEQRNAPITRYVSAADLRRLGNSVRHEIDAEAAFLPSWYEEYTGAWLAKHIAGDLWTPAPWATLNTWFGSNWPAIGYNYGTDVTYSNGNVNLYGLPVASATQYTASATALAELGAEPPPKNASWLPLGVFAAVRGNSHKSHMLFQLAVDKAGVIRGNYFNTSDNNAQLVEGALDKKTQRIAWIVKDQPNIVFDTGLYNLTKSESTALVHFGRSSTEQWTLVRLLQKPPSSD